MRLSGFRDVGVRGLGFGVLLIQAFGVGQVKVRGFSVEGLGLKGLELRVDDGVSWVPLLGGSGGLSN